MLIVKVELHSAITGEVTELGRVNIANDGTGTKEVGNYNVWCSGGRGHCMNRRGRVEGHRRLSQHVFSLIRKAIETIT